MQKWDNKLKRVLVLWIAKVYVGAITVLLAALKGISGKGKTGSPESERRVILIKKMRKES